MADGETAASMHLEMREIIDELREVTAAKWYQLGIELGLKPTTLSEIQANYPHDTQRCKHEVLNWWLHNAQPTEINWETLAQALEAIDESTTAQNLRRKTSVQAPLTKVFSAQPEIANLRRALVLELECHTVKARQTGRELGSGTYGRVIELKSGSKILAGKVFNIPSCIQPQTVISKLRKEVALMAKVHHPNIVHFEGVCFLENQTMPVLLMERLMSNLHAYLLKRTNLNIKLVVKLSILRDVASGLLYLHSRRPAIIHRDLTGNNILLDSELRAKIADFGNVQIMDVNPEATPKIFTSLPGTLDYMPPEAETDSAKYDPSLDVFSFGHLSLFTAIQSPVHPLLPSTYPDAEGLLHARSEVMRRKEYLERANKLLGEEHSLIVLIKQCLHNQPALRPRTADLETRLQDIPISTSNPSQATTFPSEQLRMQVPQGGGQAREREGGPSTVSKSFDLQEAPPPPPHESKRGQKRSPSGSSVSDDSVSPPPVKEVDHISDLEIGQSTKRTAVKQKVQSTMAFSSYKLDGVEEAREDLETGAFGLITTVKYKGMKCAAKELHINQCMLHLQLHHPHIVQSLGYYKQHQAHVLVMELLNTDLGRYIDRYGVLPNEIVYSILHDVALGLQYLHERFEPIVHKNLMACNVLLSDDMTAKIGGFGSAIVLTPSEVSSSRIPVPGNPVFMLPETSHDAYDLKHDIFSYGVLMVHILIGQEPTDLKEQTQLVGDHLAICSGPHHLKEQTQLEGDHLQKYLEAIGTGHSLMALIIRCLSNNLAERPLASKISETLNSSHFPAGKLETLHKLQQRERNQRKQEACTQSFETILSKAMRNIPASKIASYLSSLAFTESISEDQPTSKVIEAHSSYLNYHLVGDMVENFGDDELKADMRKYLTDLKKFRKQTTVSDFVVISHGKHVEKFKPLRENYTELSVKLNEEKENTTLEDVERIRKDIAHELSLPPHALLFYAVEEGSVIARFWIESRKIYNLKHKSLVELEKKDDILEITVDDGERLEMKMKESDLCLNAGFESQQQHELIGVVQKLSGSRIEERLREENLTLGKENETQKKIKELEPIVQSGESTVQTEGKLNDIESGSGGSDTLHEHMKLKIQSLEDENEKLRRQLDNDKLKSSYNSFLGVEVVGEEQLLVTNEGMNFQWKDHGFKLHVPKNALPEDIPEYSVNIKASLAGQFELPEGYELVSAVYWVKTQGKFQKPTTIEVQHCANFSNPNQLYFVRTSCAQKSLPYKFKFINGGSFISENKYGALSITHFSGIGVVKEVKHDEHSCQYCAQVYFTDKHLGGCWYYCHFVVTKDLEMCLTVVKRKYEQEYDIAPAITFAADQVALDIPDDGTTVNGWEIVPVHKAQIKKDRVDSFSSEKSWVPECVLLLKWLQKDKAPDPLEYKVKLNGTGEGSDFFRIVFHPGAVLHPWREPANSPSTPSISTLHILDEDDLRDVKSAVADLAGRWKDLGISLGIRSSKLDTINSPSTSESLREMLALWLRQGYNVERFGKPTWKRLVEAVKDDTGCNNPALAQTIANDHLGSHAVTQPHLTS